MGNFKYLLMLALAATTVFTSCSKDDDGDNDDNDNDNDPRTAIVGSYDVTGTIMEVDYGNSDTTITNNASYVLTISIPPASDSLPADFVLVRNIAKGFINKDIQSSLTNDVLVLNINDQHNSGLSGTAIFNGNTFTSSFYYYDYNAQETRFTITATKRN